MNRLSKIVKLCFCITVAFMMVTCAQGQSVDDIISKHIAAVGGKKKLKKINSLVMTVTTQIEGSNMKSVITILDGKGFLSEADFNGQKIIECVTDESGWSINPMAGQTKAASMTESQYQSRKQQIYINPFLDYAARGDKAELMGTEDAGSGSIYKIKLTTSDNAETIYLIDASTYYIANTIITGDINGQPTLITSSLSDYRETDFGNISPYTVKVSIGDYFTLTSHVTQVETNTTVDPAIFDRPE